MVYTGVLIYLKSEFYPELYNFFRRSCQFNIEFDNSVSVISLYVAFLRNQVMTYRRLTASVIVESVGDFRQVPHSPISRTG
jgi:hypothetical protein